MSVFKQQNNAEEFLKSQAVYEKRHALMANEK